MLKSPSTIKLLDVIISLSNNQIKCFSICKYEFFGLLYIENIEIVFDLNVILIYNVSIVSVDMYCTLCISISFFKYEIIP